ncbi:hypothetical protein PoB_006010400 [Plakobranchus ocellatus]|uniref:Uncharacterized protein n=1 Tax=Plakobranchus ocellatus TaxID=259542 RepID=A0AAV4CP16_9GAST|nr:hypothetical protein PoB_006010400 [Plakobranchus ocellatus]
MSSAYMPMFPTREGTEAYTSFEEYKGGKWGAIRPLRPTLISIPTSLTTIYLAKTQGTTVSTCMAPNYANLFRGTIEKQLLGTSPGKSLIWLGYIDFIFSMWIQGR